MISIKHDLDRLERKLGGMAQGLVPKAASQSINKVADSTRVAAKKAISAETAVTQKNIDKELYQTRATPNRLRAVIDAAKAKAKNLIEFVSPGQRKPNHFNARNKGGKYKAPGVKAKAWGKAKTYRGSFIQMASNGKLLVLKRKSEAGPRNGTTEGVPGPSPRGVFDKSSTREAMRRRASERMPIEMNRAINNELRKLK